MTSSQPLQLATTQSEAPADVIDFGLGHPAAGLLPRTILQSAAAQRLGEPDASLLQYGLEQGDGYFRLALADFLTRRLGSGVGYDDLFVSAGASLALDLICTLYTQPGDVVFVEEPSYFLALRIFADHRLQVVSIATDAHGVRLDALEEALRTNRPALFYVIPTHQNPSGATLPRDRRERLVALSQEHGFLVVADEVYHLLSYAAPPPPPLAAWASGGTVLSINSFSKILAPGLRLGWVQASPPHIARLVNSGLLDSGGGLNPFTSALVRVALEAGSQDAYLDHLHATYRGRIDALDAALQEALGGQVTYTRPTGGYFFWVQLPADCDAEALQAVAVRHKVGFRSGVRFSSRGELRPYLRLSFAFYEAGQLAEGAHRLAGALAEYRDTGGGRG
jgi:DNA-binding transcriptional MocR family regulator